MTASVSSWCPGNPCSTSASASISPAQYAILAASNGTSAGNGGWGCECPQHRDLLVAIGPDRRHPHWPRPHCLTGGSVPVTETLDPILDAIEGRRWVFDDLLRLLAEQD